MKRTVVALTVCMLALPLWVCAQDKTAAQLESELRQVRSKGDWAAVKTLADELVARPDASANAKSYAKLTRLSAVLQTTDNFDDALSAAEAVEQDKSITPFWHMQIFMEEAQQFSSKFKEYEIAIEKADEGIALNEEMIKQGKKNLWDRIQLLTIAKCNALRNLGENDECAETAAMVLAKQDAKKVAMQGNLAYQLLACVAVAKDDDMLFAAATEAVQCTNRMGKAAQVLNLLKNLDRLELPERDDVEPGKRNQLKNALLGAADAIKDDTDTDKVREATEQAKALADKL